MDSFQFFIKEEVVMMLRKYDFFDKDWNKTGDFKWN